MATAKAKKVEPEKESFKAEVIGGVQFVLSLASDEEIGEEGLSCKLFVGDTIDEAIECALKAHNEEGNPIQLGALRLIYMDARTFSEQRSYSLEIPAEEPLETPASEV